MILDLPRESDAIKFKRIYILFSCRFKIWEFYICLRGKKGLCSQQSSEFIPYSPVAFESQGEIESLSSSGSEIVVNEGGIHRRRRDSPFIRHLLWLIAGRLRSLAPGVRARLALQVFARSLRVRIPVPQERDYLK